MRKPTKTKPGITYVSIIVDESGSMHYYGDNVTEYYVQFLEDLSSNAKKNKQTVFVNVYFFNSSARRVATMLSPEEAESCIDQYYPNGSTALFDAIEMALNDVEMVSKQKNSAVLIAVLTDGENNINDYKGKELSKLLLKPNYTVAIQTPESGRNRLLSLGISGDNIKIWDVKNRSSLGAGGQSVYANTVGLTNYMATRGAGGQSVKSFYAPVDVDLHAVKPSEIKRQCDDVTANFKAYPVEKEVEIKPFYEAKTGREYQAGEAFFQLSKVEKVQSHKNIVVNKKGESVIWGGDNVRGLIGIPDNKDVRLNPKNLMDYNVFIESTSTNRKLVRGTKILVRK